MRRRVVAGFAGLLLSIGILGVPAVAAGTAPALPGSPRAVALNSSQIQFTWTESSTQTAFQVTDGVSYVTLSASARSYTWSGLAPNTYKCSAVRAYNSYGSSAWTSWACTTTLPSIPAVPTGITAAALSSSQIRVSWTENSNQTGFQVYDGISVVNVAGTARSYTWSGLAGNTYKCTFVRAYNSGGYSAWSAQACTTTPPSSVPQPLSVPYYHQYLGQATQNVDCGPADVAMVLQYRGRRPSGLSDMQWVVQVRTRTGASDTGCDGGPCGTTFPQLEAALTYYGATWSEVAASLTPAPSAQVAAIKAATAAGKPVIALVHGADLGRGTPLYGDHWIVVTGFTPDGNTAYVNDPDDQPARSGYPNWIVGGKITLATSTLSTAMYNAAPGPYAIIVN
jgi:hypothetical protein